MWIVKTFLCFHETALLQRIEFVFVHLHTVKPVLSGLSKIDKTKVLKTNGRFMKLNEGRKYCIQQYF